MPLDADDLMKMQSLIDRSVPRTEYENRHTELVQRVTHNEDSIKEMSRYILSEFEKARNQRDTNLNLSLDAVKEVSRQCDEIKADISAGRITTIRYIVSVIVSFAIGGGAIAFIEFARSFR